MPLRSPRGLQAGEMAAVRARPAALVPDPHELGGVAGGLPMAHPPRSDALRQDPAPDRPR
jgi:hypothetical protein